MAGFTPMSERQVSGGRRASAHFPLRTHHTAIERSLFGVFGLALHAVVDTLVELSLSHGASARDVAVRNLAVRWRRGLGRWLVTGSAVGTTRQPQSNDGHEQGTTRMRPLTEDGGQGSKQMRLSHGRILARPRPQGESDVLAKSPKCRWFTQGPGDGSSCNGPGAADRQSAPNARV
jgi:hypothetical protein